MVEKELEWDTKYVSKVEYAEISNEPLPRKSEKSYDCLAHGIKTDVSKKI